MSNERFTGKVKWFNVTKAYGFITPDNGGADVFVHMNAVQNSGLSTLNENDSISYELVDNPAKGKKSADNLKKL